MADNADEKTRVYSHVLVDKFLPCFQAVKVDFKVVSERYTQLDVVQRVSITKYSFYFVL